MKRTWLTVTACLVLSMAAGAAEYYVDAGGGDDSAAGASPQAAWRTIAKVNATALQPGDTVYLRRGSIWRETLQPNAGGAEGRPVTFAPYGAGPRPAIYGSVDRSGEANWRPAGENLWVLAGVDWSKEQGRGMLFRDGVGMRRRPGLERLEADWDWTYDAEGKRILVRLGENPGRRQIELAERNGVGFCTVPYVTLRGLEIGFVRFGVGIWQADGWVVEDCYIHDALIDCFHANGADQDPDRGVVRNCTFEDWDWTGHAMTGLDPRDRDWQRFEPSFGYGIHVLRGDGWIVTGNTLRLVDVQTGMDCTPLAFDGGANAALIEGNDIDAGASPHGGGGIMFWRPKGTVPAVIRDNVIRNTGNMGINASEFHVHQFSQPVTIEGNVLVNVNLSDSIDTEGIRVWTQFEGSGPVVVRNNVIRGTPDGQFDHPGIRVRESRNVRLEGNVITGVDAGISVERGARAQAAGNVSAHNRTYAAFVDGDSALTSEGGNVWAGRVQGFEPAESDVAGATE